MQLTSFSDYSLRVVLYLAIHEGRPVSIQEISQAYAISSHHLVKVATRLCKEGFVVAVRGRRGGLQLGRRPGDICIGDLVRATEPNMHLVECFDLDTNTCPIERACGLKRVLKRAQRAFLDELDGHSVADFLPNAPALIRLWKPAAAETAARRGAKGGVRRVVESAVRQRGRRSATNHSM